MVIFFLQRAVHAALVAATSAFGLAAFHVIKAGFCLAHRAWPDAPLGNCWSYVIPRWAQHGGYLGVRPSPGVRLAGVGEVPHCLWIKALPVDSATVEQTAPRRRYRGAWLLWRALYFRFSVLDRENAQRHNVAEVEPCR